ncbi:MAG: glutamate--tRNA ligase [Gammaproteobacteria bacterium]
MRAMHDQPITKTRFAPSPTGLLHLGNVRTALFNALYARQQRGIFLLRIEDTDHARSDEPYVTALEEDLRWLGLVWQEGPGVEGGHGPYRQSQRGETYEGYYAELQDKGLVYPCFCSDRELKLERKAQLSAGHPPRYSGRCARLDPEEAKRRLAAGEEATLRFRVPADEFVEFDDLVRGRQRFATDDIGDFIIRRANGSPAFFFSNAIDDALMGVTHVLRGEDHLTNTPRQLMLLQALELPAPRYGHISMIVGDDGAPLSKRHGSSTLADLRERGYLPMAINAYLARLGHHFSDDERVTLEELAEGFSLSSLGKAPARFDEAQLRHWQRVCIDRSDVQDLLEWAGRQHLDPIPRKDRVAFLEMVRPNILFPSDLHHWSEVVYGDLPPWNDEARRLLSEAAPGLFTAAAKAVEAGQEDLAGLSNALKSTLGIKGKALFQPLRVALTGGTGGPELGRILELMPSMLKITRLRMAAALQSE